MIEYCDYKDFSYIRVKHSRLVSRDFIKDKRNCNHLAEACRQQEQIRHFVLSKVQPEVSPEYLKTWAERKYRTNDHFLNFVKSIFKTQNFLSFYKYLRYPLASASLVNDRIKDPLKRVFFSEDSYFKCVKKGKDFSISEHTDVNNLNEKLFNALLFRYNDILITDVDTPNNPFHDIVKIENVVAIESKDSVINKIAYCAYLGQTPGIAYIDSEVYAFYPNSDEIPETIVPHDLGKCPAEYIAPEPLDESENDVVRKSIFSFVREQMEEYVFLKTLQRMTEPNGAIPVTSQLKAKAKGENKDIHGESPKEPMNSFEIGSQRAEYGAEIGGNSTGYDGQTGTNIYVPMMMKSDGSVDYELSKNWFTFHYMPVESLTYLNERVKEVRDSIVSSILGDFTESNESAKNELQVGKSFVSKEDRLRNLSRALSRIRTNADYNFIGLKFGTDGLFVDNFFGSEFFFESQSEVYDMLLKSPNPIESKGLLIRLAHTKNKFNPDKYNREKILYQLLPYATATDFQTAVASAAVGEITFQFQTRFNYWIDLFEAEYGDLLQFWNNMEATEKEKTIAINMIINNLIKNNYEQREATVEDGTPAGV